jgi:geranylgeranyl diphosphate synthase type II
MAVRETVLSTYLSARRLEIEAVLERLVPPASAWPETIHRAIRHSLFAGGKRLRPILCLAAGEAVGGAPEPLLEPAGALEMIHTYSLIHDDLPALDDDNLRRGVPTCHVVFGEDMAILAGDALLTLGLATLARYPERAAFDGAKIRALRCVTDAIGTAGMIGGQVADLEAEVERHPTAELLMRIHDAKTACLIRASLAVGGILSSASPQALGALDRYGLALGLAFQIKDDLLDVEADSATLGKSSGKDAAQGKATFPAVWGIERSRAILAEKVDEAIETARSLPAGGGRLPELARFVGERKS